MIDPEGNPTSIPYNMATSIEAIMLATGEMTQQRLSMADLLRSAQIAQKITAATDEILLEENEYQIIKKSFDAFRGFSRNEVEMCRRISDAPTVEVEEKKEKESKK